MHPKWPDLTGTTPSNRNHRDAHWRARQAHGPAVPGLAALVGRRRRSLPEAHLPTVGRREWSRVVLGCRTSACRSGSRQPEFESGHVGRVASRCARFWSVCPRGCARFWSMSAGEPGAKRGSRGEGRGSLSRETAQKQTRNRSKSRDFVGEVVGAPGFGPGTSCAQGRRATRLRYAPTVGRRTLHLLSWNHLAALASPGSVPGSTRQIPSRSAKVATKVATASHRRTLIISRARLPELVAPAANLLEPAARAPHLGSQFSSRRPTRTFTDARPGCQPQAYSVAAPRSTWRGPRR